MMILEINVAGFRFNISSLLPEHYTTWKFAHADPYCQGAGGNHGFVRECYNASMLPDLKLNDILQLRKPHPCGEDKWKVVRLGGDIKIECLGCGRRIMLSRRKLAQKTKKKVAEGEG